MTHVLLVCTGNICRSPLAEALMQRELEERGIEAVSVSSAGTGAWEGAPASEGAYLIALEHGLDVSQHRAQLLTRDVVQNAAIVFTMARHHRARVEELGGDDVTHVLGEYAGLAEAEAEVSDPFGSDLEVYRETFDQLNALVPKAVDRLVEELADADHGG